MSAGVRGDERPGPVGEAFGELWREGLFPEALMLAGLASHVRTRAGECFPERLVGPQWDAVGVDAVTVGAIVDELISRGLVARLGEARASRFYVCRAIADEIVGGRREEVRRRLRLVAGGKRDERACER